MFLIDLFAIQAASTDWDRNFIYLVYGIAIVTLTVAFFVLRRKDESSADFKQGKNQPGSDL